MVARASDDHYHPSLLNTNNAAFLTDGNNNNNSSGRSIRASTAAAAGLGDETHQLAPQEDLITFPRFKPHALMQPTLFSTADPAGGVSLHDAGILAGGDDEQGGEGDRGGGGGGSTGRVEAANVTTGAGAAGGTKLLNAWEKIEELEGLVESSRSHNER